MDWKLLFWALPAGAAATLNPCGVAMLPAYIAYYLGKREVGPTDPLKGVEAGLLLAAGVLAVFTVMGALIAAVGSVIASAIPWLALAVAVGLLALAVATLLGRDLALPLPAFAHRGPQDRGRAGFLSYGVGYGLASLGCTLPIFMIVVSSVLSAGFVSGLAAFVAYGAGMGVMLIAVAVAVSAGKAALVRGLRRAAPALRYVGGLGLLAAGAYLLAYNLQGLQFRATGGINRVPTVVAVVAGLAALALAVGLAVLRSARRTPASAGDPEPGRAPGEEPA